MRALMSLILSSMMLNLSVQARSSATSSDSSTNQNMDEEHGQEKQQKNLSPQRMEDSYTGKYPKRKFKGYDKYPKTRLPESTPQEILQTQD